MKGRVVGSVVVACWLVAALEIACSGPTLAHDGSPDGVQNADGAVATGDATPPGPDGSPSFVTPAWDAQPPPFMDPFGGASGCDGGVDAGVDPVALVMPVQGALNTVLGWPNGVSGGGGTGQLYWQAALPDATEADVGVILLLSQLRAGVVGPQPSTTLEIRWMYDRPDADSIAAWLSPSGGCTVTIASNVCAPNFEPVAGKVFYVASGTGSCSQPMVPESGNPYGPLTVGDFYFVSYFEVSTGDH